jgi:hypothetical protein
VIDIEKTDRHRIYLGRRWMVQQFKIQKFHRVGWALPTLHWDEMANLMIRS